MCRVRWMFMVEGYFSPPECFQPGAQYGALQHVDVTGFTHHLARVMPTAPFPSPLSLRPSAARATLSFRPTARSSACPAMYSSAFRS